MVDIPPILKGCNRWLSRRRKSAFRYMLVFAMFLISYITYIHTKFSFTLIAKPIANNIKTSKTDRIGNLKVDNDKLNTQKVVVLYGTPSSGYLQVQNDFALWMKEFKLYPWAWALPELVSEKYTKDQNFIPYVNSLMHVSFMIPENEPFDVKGRHLANYYLSQFRDGFINQWVQNRNILIGSDKFSYFLDETNGDYFMEAFIKTMPWNDPRYSLTKQGQLSVIIFHSSSYQDHLRKLWMNSAHDHTNSNSQNMKFSSWIVNDFNYDVIDSYGLAYALVKRGIPVSMVNVDKVEEDLSHFVLCNVLKFSCEGDFKGGLMPTEQKIPPNLFFDVKDDTLDEVKRVMSQHESPLIKCLEGNQLFHLYPQKVGLVHNASSGPCPTSFSNFSVKHEIRRIILANEKKS